MQDMRSTCTQANKSDPNLLFKLEDVETELRNDSWQYGIFMDRFVSCGIGHDSFRKNDTNQPISQVLAVTDETTAVLILKNFSL
jgi:hypothetical protein